MAQVGISNISTGQTSAPLYTDVAYAGLKYGLGYDLTLGLIYCQSDIITPGIVMCVMADGTGALPSVAVAAASPTTIVPFGIMVRDALLDHAPNPYFFPPNAPQSGVALSIMSRGSIWAQVSAGGTCTSLGPVKYNGDGTVNDAGTYTLPHAVFRTVATPLSDGSSIVVVELHSPFAA